MWVSWKNTPYFCQSIRVRIYNIVLTPEEIAELAGQNDSDNDGLVDAQELTFGSNPFLADMDGDGLLDGAEQQPRVDTDGDGFVNILDPDSDNDGLPDGLEVVLGLNPLSADRRSS
jgi:hypothetical protein